MVFSLNETELNDALQKLADVIRFSLSNDLGIHVAIGGKFAELYVAYELWKHKPKLGRQKDKINVVKNPKSCDIVLEATKKKLEVKWSALHNNDQFAKKCDNKPFWGMGLLNREAVLRKEVRLLHTTRSGRE
jgi:hypothetical protein